MRKANEPDLYSNISNPEHPSYLTGFTEDEWDRAHESNYSEDNSEYYSYSEDDDASDI